VRTVHVKNPVRRDDRNSRGVGTSTSTPFAVREDKILEPTLENPGRRTRPAANPLTTFSPFRYTVAITCVGYVILVLLNWLEIGRNHLGLSSFVAAVVDTTVFLVAVLPLLYFLMFRPMQRYVEQREQAIQELEQAKARLEERVGERTHELADAGRAAQESLQTLEETHRDSTLLGELIELLQASRTAAEAEDMLRRFGEKLFPTLGGAIYLYRSSRNILERAACWNGEPASPETFTPEDCWALRRGRQHLAEVDQKNPRCRHFRQVPAPATSLCVAMMAQGETTGVLVLHRESLPGQSAVPISERARQLALTAVEQIALALSNLQLREKLRDQAIRDPLTAMFNRRYFEETAERELRRAEQEGVSVGVIMMDLDHFKRLNDTRGHEAGDVALRRIGLVLQNKTRVEDIACRYGGEEFLLLLPGVSLDALVSRANQIREAMKEMDLRFHGEILGPITVSCGVAIFPDHGRTCIELTEAADRALYVAKQTGRDKVVVAS
jgi:diguanylate cyclase (GGDEF)-like protein